MGVFSWLKMLLKIIGTKMTKGTLTHVPETLNAITQTRAWDVIWGSM